MFTLLDKLASAIYNDIVGGLRGYHTNSSINLEQLKDEIIDERLLVLKEYSLNNKLPVRDLYMSINCIEVDCKDLERCSCNTSNDCITPTAHFEIPQILNDYGRLSIDYLGSSDRLLPFVFYTSSIAFRNHKYRKRGKDKPYVWIDTTPNENGMYDCFIFNAPLLKTVSITAIFKDIRQLEKYSCCIDLENDNMTFINNEVKRRLTEKKIRYYRMMGSQNLPNNLLYI